jgi:hypothetical protein
MFLKLLPNIEREETLANFTCEGSITLIPKPSKETATIIKL